MESEGYIYIIYDKYRNNSHAFDDEITKKITIESIFSSEYNIQYENLEALNLFNKLFQNKINDDIDFNIYRLLLLFIEDSIITVIVINIAELESYYNKHLTIPNRDFIIKACTYDKMYQDSNYSIDTIDVIEEKITGKLLQPSTNVYEINNPSFLKIELYPYQKRTINWLIECEKSISENKTRIYVNINSEFEIKIGNLNINPINKSITKIDTYQNSIDFYGGALIDEVGLGKTIQMLALSLLNRSNNLSIIKDGVINSNATLIICPNQLCGQWKREIDKMIKSNVKVILILTKVHFDKITYYELIDADFIIVSYNFLLNPSFLNEWLITDSIKKSSLTYLNNEEYENIKKNLEKINTKITGDINNLFETKPILPIINWHRIMVDEFHELNSGKTAITHILSLFKSNYKWCITGTPFNNTNGLINILKFITNNNSFMHQELYRNHNIKNYILNNLFVRNTKQSIDYKFPLLKQRIIWLRFTPTERMIYNAYLTDTTISKILLRQLCCHPQIVEEIKGVLTNCKTLKEIENTMVMHYKNSTDKAKLIVDEIENKIKYVNREIKITVYKKQRKFLRQLGYKVKVIFPPKLDYVKKEDLINDNINLQENEEVSNDEKQDENKELIIVNEENQEQITLKIGELMKNDDQVKSLDKLNEYLNKLLLNLDEAKSEYKNKLNTFNFYNNMLEKLKKCTSAKKDNDDSCGICLGNIGDEQIGVTKCGHIFCYECIKLTVNQKQQCPVCMKSITINEIYQISYEKQTNTKCITNKLELINNIGTKLANLVFYLKSIDDHVVIFSHWDELLKRIGDVLNSHGIKNVFCRGNVWQRDKILRTFNEDDSIRIIMLSSESAASGTNLTKASKVIFIEPIDGTADYIQQTEWQAIGRVYRLGQAKTVEIIRFIVKDTIEEEIYKNNLKNKTISPLNICETLDSTIDLSTDAIRDINRNIYKSKKNK